MKRVKQIFSFEFFRTLIAIGIAFVAAVCIIFLVSKEPLQTLFHFLIGPLTTVRRMGNILETALPYIFTALSVCVMFEANQFNMLSEGCFFFGALWAAVFAILVPAPAGISTVLAILAGSLMGGLIGAIPAYLKAKWNTSEFVVSLMLNYVILYFSIYLMNIMIRDSSAGSKVSQKFAEGSKLMVLIPGTRIHAGIFIAIAMVILVHVFLCHSKWGYKIRMTGMNQKFALHSGINTFAVIIYSQVIGGVVAGMGGAVEMLGIYERFQWSALPNYGFDGITVAIIARQKPKLVPIAALFLAYIRTGADVMSRLSDVPNEVVSVIQALVIILVAASAFLGGWNRRRIVKGSMSQIAEKGGA